MTNAWAGKLVAVTGGGGFVGSFLVDHLLNAGARVRVISRRPDSGRLPKGNVELHKADLGNAAAARPALRGVDYAFHLASSVGGVAFNQSRPASLFASNLQLHLNFMEAARLENVAGLGLVSSTCVYSRNAPVPTEEGMGFFDHPEPANRGYGWSKRMLELMGRFYRDEYGIPSCVVRPANVYGPRDNFDEAFGHVIPSLIVRAFQATKELLIWGDGTQTRSFIYVDDVARGALLAAERLKEPDPVNLASNQEVTILDLAREIVQATGRPLRLITDPSKPVGQVRKAADPSKAKNLLGFEAKVPLSDGVRRTVEWFQSHRRTASVGGLPA